METSTEKPALNPLDLEGSASAHDADAPESQAPDAASAEDSTEDDSFADGLSQPDSLSSFDGRQPLEPLVELAPADLSPRPISPRMEKRIYDDGFAHGKAAAYEEFRQEQIAYYRNLRDAGARAFGKMPDSRPSGEFLASPRQGFWAD